MCGMAIYRSTSDGAFDPEALAVMAAAYEDILSALDLRDRADPITELVAKKIVYFVGQGELDPAKVRDKVMQSLGPTQHSRP